MPGPAETPIWTPPAVVPHHHEGPCECEPTLVYIRVSKVGERDPDSLLSPDIQLDSCVVNARLKNKRIVKVVCDINASGRTFRARSVDGVIDDIKNGVAKSVTLWKWSRWGRNVEFSTAYLAKAKAVGGRVDSATEDFDQTTAFGRFSQKQIMAFDELHSDLIGEGWQAAHRQRRNAGLPHSGRKRFGYDYITRAMIKAGDPHAGSDDCARCSENVPHFVENPTEGPAVVRLYEKYVAGVSPRSLTPTLREFTTPLGNGWTPQAVILMLDTGFAAGLLRARTPELIAQYKAGGKSIPNNPATYDTWIKGSHKALISPELWDKYKRRRAKQSTTPPALRAPRHALSALLFCGVCARRMQTKYSGANRGHSWYCTWKDTLHATTPVSISNGAALEIVKKWIEDKAKPPVSVEIDTLAEKSFQQDEPGPGRPIATIEKEIEDETKAASRLVVMSARGLINDDQFAAALTEIESGLEKLRAELKEVSATRPMAVLPDYQVFGKLADVWDEALALQPASLNAPLQEVLAYVIVQPAAGRGRWHDASTRVELVGTWDSGSKDAWFLARRRRFDA